VPARCFYEGSSVLAELRVVVILLAVSIVFVACGETGTDESAEVIAVTEFAASVEPDSGSTSAVVGPPDSGWSWQLTGVLDTSVDVDVWDVDLFETGAAEIAGLQAAGGYVICYFSVGAISV